MQRLPFPFSQQHDIKTSRGETFAMKAAKKRDLNLLRKEILSEILQHPYTSLPLAVSIISGAWAALVAPSAITLMAAVAGAGAAILGAAYNLIFRGAEIRDGILADWEREAEEEEDMTAQALIDSIVAAGHSDDILDLYDEIDILVREARDILKHPSVSEVMRTHFLPIIEENWNSAIAVFNKLAFLQQRLTNLEEARHDNPNAFHQRIHTMRENRMRLMTHLRDLAAALEKMTIEIPQYAADHVDYAERQLRQLEDSLEATRKAHQKLSADARPPSSDYHRHTFLHKRGKTNGH